MRANSNRVFCQSRRQRQLSGIILYRKPSLLKIEVTYTTLSNRT